MASLRTLPLDLVKEIVSFLDFDALALLYWTLDLRMQRFLVASAGASVPLTFAWTAPLHPASRYFLKSLKDLHQLNLTAASRNDAVNTKDRSTGAIVHLSPRSLAWHTGTPFRRPIAIDYRCLFQSLTKLKLEVLEHTTFRDLVRSFPLLPPKLEHFHMIFSLPRSESSPVLTSLIKALPKNLVHFAIEDSTTRPTPLDLPLQLVCTTMTKLETLKVHGINCSSGGATFNLPTCLTSLDIVSYLPLTEANLKDSNLTQLAVRTLPEPESHNQTHLFDIEKLAPRTLTHLDLTISRMVQTLPPHIVSLKAECCDVLDLVALLERLILPLKHLRTLFITLRSNYPNTTRINVKLPHSLENMHLYLTVKDLSLKALLRIVGDEALSTPHLSLEFETLSLTSIINYALTLPQAKLKVHEICRPSPTEILLLLGELWTLSSLQQEGFCPDLTLEAISKYLNGAGRLEFRLCLCPGCLVAWQSNFQLVKRLVVPMDYNSGRAVASYGGISFANRDYCSHFQSFVELPPSLKKLELILPGLYSRQDSIVYSLERTLRVSSLQELAKLKVLDLGAVPIRSRYEANEFWTVIPRSVTTIRSTYDLDPQVKLGGAPNYVSTDDCFPSTPLDLHCLDTPYLVYDLEELPKLCSPSTLTSLSATIKAEDTSIFEFALHRGSHGTHSFPQLQKLKLRALPIVTGTLFCSHHARVTLRSLQHELAEVFQSLDVLVIGCLYSNTVAIHPSVTHAILDDIPNTMVLARLDNHLRELKGAVATVFPSLPPDVLQFPQSVTSLDLALLHNGYNSLPTIPPLPLKLRHWRLRVAHLPRSSNLTRSPAIGEAEDKLPRGLETIQVLGSLPDVLKPLFLSHLRLPQLSLREMTSADDVFLVEVAEFTGRLLPLDLVDFSWKTAFSQCLALEARFPNLEIAAWKASSLMEIGFTQVKTVCLNLDFRFDSLFDAATRVHKKRYISLMKDLVTLQAEATVPIDLPNSVERLELSISRKLFQDAPFKEFEKTVPILATRMLLEKGCSCICNLPNLTHLTIRRVDLPNSSVLEGSVLPKSLQVLNICVNGKIRKEKELRLVKWQLGPPNLREVNLGPFLKLTTVNTENVTFQVTASTSLI